MLYRINHTDIIKIGSVGKRPDDYYHGDIDLAIHCRNFIELNKIVNTLFPESVYQHYMNQSKNLYLHSISYPYLDFRGFKCFVQVDFMLSINPEYTKFRYYCPDYRTEKTNYKVYARILLLKIILNNCDSNHYNLSPIGVFNKKESTYITDVPEILSLMFVNNVTNDDIGTTEKLWNMIHSEKFKHPEMLAKIEKAFFIVAYSQPWENLNLCPEDFILKHWSAEEIREDMKQLNKINNLNLELIKIQQSKM